MFEYAGLKNSENFFLISKDIHVIFSVQFFQRLSTEKYLASDVIWWTEKSLFRIKRTFRIIVAVFFNIIHSFP